MPLIDLYTLKSHPIKRTRTSHHCLWCGTPIAIGSPAQYRVSIYDGFATEYWHKACYAAADRVNAHTCGAWSFEPGSQPYGAINLGNIWEE